MYPPPPPPSVEACWGTKCGRRTKQEAVANDGADPKGDGIGLEVRKDLYSGGGKAADVDGSLEPGLEMMVEISTDKNLEFGKGKGKGKGKNGVTESTVREVTPEEEEEAAGQKERSPEEQKEHGEWGVILVFCGCSQIGDCVMKQLSECIIDQLT